MEFLQTKPNPQGKGDPNSLPTPAATPIPLVTRANRSFVFIA